MPSGYYKADLISHFQSEITVKLSVLRCFFFFNYYYTLSIWQIILVSVTQCPVQEER